MTRFWDELKLPTTYLLGDKTTLWKRYQHKHPDGVGRTTFFNALQSCHYEYVKVLKGLCNICDNFGFRAFDKLDQTLVLLLDKLPGNEAQIRQLQARAKALHKYLRKNFIHNVTLHSTTATHCIQRCFATESEDIGGFKISECSCATETHTMDCADCNERFLIFQEIHELLAKLEDTDKQNLTTKVEDIAHSLAIYVGHLMRTVHQREVLHTYLKKLTPGSCVMILDFKMKFIFQLFRENCASWYGKKGASVLGILYFYKKPDTPDDSVEMEYYDICCEIDTKQDWFWVASAIEATTNNFRERHPTIVEEYRISDNGPHFHNTSLMIWGGVYYEVCVTTLSPYNILHIANRDAFGGPFLL